jgi:hypothetical protein
VLPFKILPNGYPLVGLQLILIETVFGINGKKISSYNKSTVFDVLHNLFKLKPTSSVK